MKIIFLFLLISQTLSAEISYAMIADRCTEQNLNPEQGKIRRAWAKKCFHELGEYIETSFFKNKYPLVWSPSQNSWQGPLNEHAPCGDWVVKAICLASCYTPDQHILFESGNLPIAEALERNEQTLMVLQEGSSLENPILKPIAVYAYSRSWQESHEIIRVIKTKSGGQLKVTLNHPILLGSGVMIEAKDLEIGDLLIRQNGQRDPVVSIENIDYFGKVFNITPNSMNPDENILVAEGFLVGSGAYQYTEELHARIRTKDR